LEKPSGAYFFALSAIENLALAWKIKPVAITFASAFEKGAFEFLVFH
jgi:hypothetical protein